MSYSEHVAKVIADQLARFVTLNRHQLAGQVANLEFWVAEARHAMDIIDGYEQRFRRLKAAQIEYVNEHNTKVALPPDGEFEVAPSPPRRTPDAILREARRSVSEATYRFLVRCYNDGLLPEANLHELCDDLGIGIDSSDLHRSRRKSP